MMAAFDLAETSSALERLFRQLALKLPRGCRAFGGCPWFHVKPSAGDPAGTGTWPLWFVARLSWRFGAGLRRAKCHKNAHLHLTVADLIFLKQAQFLEFCPDNSHLSSLVAMLLADVLGST